MHQAAQKYGNCGRFLWPDHELCSSHASIGVQREFLLALTRSCKERLPNFFHLFHQVANWSKVRLLNLSVLFEYEELPAAANFDKITPLL